MIISTSAFGKASARNRVARAVQNHHLSTAAPPRGYGTNDGPRSVHSVSQRELVLDVLTANATKRDAKQYLARFKPNKQPGPTSLRPSPLLPGQHHPSLHATNEPSSHSGVNPEGLYRPTRAIAEAPRFTKHDDLDEPPLVERDEAFFALVCLRAPEQLDSATLDGVALTLSQLVKLHTRILLVLDCGSSQQATATATSKLKSERELFDVQAHRLCAALKRHGSQGGRPIACALKQAPYHGGSSEGTSDHASVSVGIPSLLSGPLTRGVIPVVSRIACSESGQKTVISTADTMSALVKEYATRDDGSSIDRIILLDSLGGIPSRARDDGSHIFINLEQEYNDIVEELTEYASSSPANKNDPSLYQQHLANLETLRDCLALLPPDSSALIVSPREVAASSQPKRDEASLLNASTRRQKNTLIHNLLTNRPVISSSLPAARHATVTSQHGNTAQAIQSATMIKRGMPLAILPPCSRGEYWTRPTSGTASLSVTSDSRVDVPRLVHLIDQSFRRKLDVSDYFSRIEGRTAGLIIAGNYEGGAVLTWESPPDCESSERLVPYLDKFAVLPSSQGSSGVADVVFQAMVRKCFPRGVCWRSRRDNPVNKWYFERSSGSWDIPDTQWTMFWTGEDVADNPQRWADYVAVCRNVKPSWADQRPPD